MHICLSEVFQCKQCIDASTKYLYTLLLPAAIVGLERTFCNVSEDVGVVEVCAIVYSPNITCPIQFPFDFNLSTSDNTAGNILVHSS